MWAMTGGEGVVLPLDGVKVLDFSRFLSGPYCTSVLADMGADVTKVERFPNGDDARRLEPKVNGESFPFATANRNKRSLCLDLKSDEGRDIFLRLAKDADVIIENFRPGVTKRLGVDYEAVKELNDRIIYCSITGFGQTGPYAMRAGFDIIAQGVSGFMRINGHPGDEKPAKVGIAINDIAAGATALYSILGAYIHRLNAGEGQYIDISLVDSGLAWTIWEAGAYFGSGELPAPAGSRHRRTTPYQAYRTKDGYVTVGANNDRLWHLFCEQVVERPEWMEDPRYQDLPARMRNIDDLEGDIEEVLAEHPTEHWVRKLDEAGVPGGPVLLYDEVMSNDHVQAREMVVEVEHPIIGKMKTLGIPAKLSGTPLSIRRPAPWLGQHTVEALLEADYSEEEISDFFEKGIIFDAARDGEEAIVEYPPGHLRRANR
jgi:crotonobetainyl-CoA:carnitine CoA-transferase CaiB-like acyl-CoA transferase